MAGERRYDLVLWGASGYTGQYTAEHIATHFPTNFNWALAGRSRDKLLNIARGIKDLNPDRKEPGEFRMEKRLTARMLMIQLLRLLSSRTMIWTP